MAGAWSLGLGQIFLKIPEIRKICKSFKTLHTACISRCGFVTLLNILIPKNIIIINPSQLKLFSVPRIVPSYSPCFVCLIFNFNLEILFMQKQEKHLQRQCFNKKGMKIKEKIEMLRIFKLVLNKHEGEKRMEL